MKQAINRRRPKGDAYSSDNSKIMRAVIKDPIGTAEDAQSRYCEGEGSWLKEKYEILAVVYALGQHLQCHGSAWRKFIQQPFFKYRKHPIRPIKDQPKALRLAMYFVLGANNDAKRDRAATYARGLAVLVRRNVRADDVAAEIEKADGIEALAKLAKSDPTRPQRYEPSEQPDYYFVGDDDEDLEASAAKADEEDAAEIVTGANGQEEACRGRAFDPRGRRIVEIEVTDEQWERFMALKPGEKVVARIENRGRDEKGWRRLGTRHVFQWPPPRSKSLHTN